MLTLPSTATASATASTPNLAPGHLRVSAIALYLPAVAYLLISAHVLLTRGERFALPRVEDDAFYYLVIAKHIAATGRSDFTPGILTNGYQPLWMLAVLAIGSIFGFVTTTLKSLDILTTFAGFLLFARLFRTRDLLAASFYLVLLWYVLETMAINGMESSLLFPGLVLFIGVYLSQDEFIARHRAPLIFFATAFCIGSRIDAALFLAPLLAVAPVTRRAKLAIAAGLASCGLAYALFNLFVFGAPLPVSASVKSLGGLQLNHTYFAQLVRELEWARVIRLRSAANPYMIAPAVLGLAAFLHRRHAGLRLPLQMAAAGACGLALFAAKIAFLSSWGVWTWYAFPTLFFVLLAIWMLETSVPASRALRVVQVGWGALLLVTQVQSVLDERPGGFAAASRRFIEERAEVLAGQTLAMGDRSGSFAYDYEGGVYQLEGLVNAVQYLDTLKQAGDLRQHLCANHVPLVVNYEVPLGDYETHRIEVLRPHLTAFRGPYLTVARSEELTMFEDSSQYREENSRLYAWRLVCSH
jgi:hypothetical protein